MKRFPGLLIVLLCFIVFIDLLHFCAVDSLLLFSQKVQLLKGKNVVNDMHMRYDLMGDASDKHSL